MIILWPKNTSEAREIQESLRERVKIVSLRKEPSFISGVDASFTSDSVIAVATLYTYPDLEPIQDVYMKEKIRFPYIPGFLTFREGPAIIKAIMKLRTSPDVIMFDGQGIAHPRGIGIASHIGALLDKPTIGSAKSRLVGDFKEPAKKKGSWTYLYYNDSKVGAVLRTRDYVKPVFVSPGHKIDIKSSINVVMNCISKYRIPEPIRRADFLSKRIRNQLTKGS